MIVEKVKMIEQYKSPSGRLHGLDHLRAIAILLVMIYHYGRGIPDWLEPIKQIGWTGVDLFFVLSGYLISSQLLKEYQSSFRIDLRRFYLKRFFRIVPAYLFVLILYYSLGNLREGSGMPPFWKFLSFTQNLGLDAQHQKSFSHAWSLCIEEQFYLLLPITILSIFSLRIQRGSFGILLALIALGFAFRIHNWQEHVQPFIENHQRREMVYGFLEKVYYPTYNRMDGLLIGVGIAILINYRSKWTAVLMQYGNLLLLSGVVLFLIAYQVCESLLSYRTVIYGFPFISLTYGLIVLAALSPTCILYRLKSRITLFIATWSYALYLIHKQLFYLTKLGIKAIGWELQNEWSFWICMLVAFVGGWLLYRIVEQPFLKLRNKLLNKREKGSFAVILQSIKNKVFYR